MHLTDRGGSDRLLGELEEQALDRLTELLAYDLLDVGEGKRADLVLELSQLDDDVRRDDVGPRGEQLPELHERRAELVEHLAQVLASLRRRRSVRRDLGRAGKQVGQLVAREEVAEAVLDRHLSDL